MNRDLLTKVLLFAIGAGVGSVVTWKVVSAKYEQIIQDEIDSVKEVFSKRESLKNDTMEKENLDIKESKDTVDDYCGIIDDNGYKAESFDREEKEEEDDDMGRPEIIAPEESWECDYPTLSLTYYEGDGVLANDDGKIIENADELVGEDFASHFGEYEDDSVFVRNDKMKVYYEILRDLGSYSENY